MSGLRYFLAFIQSDSPNSELPANNTYHIYLFKATQYCQHVVVWRQGSGYNIKVRMKCKDITIKVIMLQGVYILYNILLIITFYLIQ